MVIKTYPVFINFYMDIHNYSKTLKIFKCIWHLLIAELTENSAFFQAMICFDHEGIFPGITLR